MRPSRKSQPYKKGQGARAPSAPLAAMQKGRTAFGYNPQDLPRLATKRAAKRRRLQR